MEENQKRKIIQTSFLVPITEDESVGNGDLHPYTRWERLQSDLFVNFQGSTLAPGPYRGDYPDPDTGEKITDLSRKYYVAIEEKDLGKLRKFLKEVVGPLFRQKCIYFEARGEVEFIESDLRKLDMFP